VVHSGVPHQGVAVLARSGLVALVWNATSVGFLGDKRVSTIAARRARIVRGLVGSYVGADRSCNPPAAAAAPKKLTKPARGL
jgi:hypothetical protein